MATDPNDPNTGSRETDDHVPVFRTWNAWYTVVIGFLVAQILLYFLLTIALA